MVTTSETITYMGSEWVQIDDNVITVGVHEDGLEAVDAIEKVDLPQEGEAVEIDEICGELTTGDGPINIFAPVTGAIVEINSAVVENPSLIMEDPYGEGWLFKIEASNSEEIEELVSGASYEH